MTSNRKALNTISDPRM